MEDNKEPKNLEAMEEASEPILDVKILNGRFKRLEQKNTHRDIAHTRIKAVLEGRIHDLAPEIFAVDGAWKEPIIANMINIAAKDLADMLSQMPTFTCSSSTMTTEAKRARATKKTQISAGYLSSSKLGLHLRKAVEQYAAYGFTAARVEPNYEKSVPTIHFINPIGAYYEKNRGGDVVAFYQRQTVDRQELAVRYPELAPKILKRKAFNSFMKESTNDATMEIIFYHDKNWDIVFAAGEDAYVIDKQPNMTGTFNIRVAEVPGSTDVPRGQFDDIIFLQLAQAEFALLQMKAAYEAVNAPLAVPDDVTEYAMGEGAIIKSKTPQNIRRVPIEIPQSAMVEGQTIERQLQLGSRMPNTRTGNTQANIITGQGIKALEGGYDSMIAAHQSVLAIFLQELISLSFEMDEKIFGGYEKTLTGSENGTSFEITYNASKDIAGDYTVTVRYGVMAGLDTNRAMIYSLQGLQAGLFSKDLVRRELPFSMDIEDEERKILLEKMDDAAVQALLNYSQSIPALAQQGQDPTAAIQSFAKAGEAIRKGKSMTEALEIAFKQPEPPKPTPEELAMQEAQAGMGMGSPTSPADALSGMGGGLPMGGPAGAPQGPPDIATLMASMGMDGSANMTARVTNNTVL
jgi:hypothetical protein